MAISDRLLAPLSTRAQDFDHSHALWGEALKNYSSKGLVDYKGLKKDPGQLRLYIESLKELDAAEFNKFSKDQQLAFWINAYNALTVQVILDHYPIKRLTFHLKGLAYPANSIRQIPGVWDDIKFFVAGRKVSLGYIEHKILRKEFQEPRIHFAISCASLGCPSMAEEAYRAETVRDQLQKAAKSFVADESKGVRWDVRTKELSLSPIFKWFREDFGDPIPFLAKFVASEKKNLLLETEWDVEWLSYDWSLNEWKK